VVLPIQTLVPELMMLNVGMGLTVTVNVPDDVATNATEPLIQIVPFVHFISSGNYVLQTQQITAYNIPLADPYAFTFSWNDWSTVSDTVDIVGFAIRNNTAGSNVSVTNCFWTLDIR
jgi:hypothetical protein